MDAGKKLKEIREGLGLNQAEFGRRVCNYTASHICRIENGENNPTEEFLGYVATEFHIDFEELCLSLGRIPTAMQPAIAAELLKKKLEASNAKR